MLICQPTESPDFNVGIGAHGQGNKTFAAPAEEISTMLEKLPQACGNLFADGIHGLLHDLRPLNRSRFDLSMS